MELINHFRPKYNADGILEIEISDKWALWGPNGGYLAAIALMSISKEVEELVPVSFHCQFLNVAKFSNVQIRSTCLKHGYSAKAYEVVIEQDGLLILNAQIWLGKYQTALNYTEITNHNWGPLSEAVIENWSSSYKFWENIEVRSNPSRLENKTMSNENVFTSWFRFVHSSDLNDRWLNAARLLILVDTLQWMATWVKFKSDKLEYIAPSLDLTAHFHDLEHVGDWLFAEALARNAENGFITNQVNIRNEEGRLIADGTGRLICKKIAV